jgi:hypothetical protein
MQLQVLKKGMKGPLVGLWQEFLHGEGLYKHSIDCDFGGKTDASTKRYEGRELLPKDGIVDDELWGRAMGDGLVVAGSRWSLPEKPSFKPLSVSQKHQRFGTIKSKPAPTPKNREAIKITNNWQSEHLVKVVVPQLAGVTGAPRSGAIFANRLAAEPIQTLFQVWEERGLLHLVRSWAGSWVPRYVRRAPGVLSSHAWGTAFDINAAWNGLSRQPAARGRNGTVIPLVESANECGFWWGGHWKRPDGMHFELVQVNAWAYVLRK